MLSPLPGPLPEGEGNAGFHTVRNLDPVQCPNLLMTLPPPQGEGWEEGIKLNFKIYPLSRRERELCFIIPCSLSVTSSCATLGSGVAQASLSTRAMPAGYARMNNLTFSCFALPRPSMDSYLLPPCSRPGGRGKYLFNTLQQHHNQLLFTCSWCAQHTLHILHFNLIASSRSAGTAPSSSGACNASRPGN